MDFKVNLKNLMEENELSLYKLDKICDLSINTLKKLINNPSHNAKLESLSILARVFDCSIKDLIEDNSSIINYEKIAEELNEEPLFSQNQVFSPDNIKYLKMLLLQVGVLCKISSYCLYRTASIENEYELSSIQVDFNIRILEVEKKSILHVINFYVSVNHALINESVIKDAFIKVLEKYARKLSFDEIRFTIDQDFKRKVNQYSDSHSEIPADFTYTFGTKSILFTQNNFERSPYSEFEKYQIEWRKKLS